MDIIQFLHLTGVMHAISQALIVPTVVVLLLLIAYAIYTLGSFVFALGILLALIAN